MISCACGSQVHREDPLEQVVVDRPLAGDLGRQRRCRPGVHHVGIAHEPAGHSPLVLGEPGGSLGLRVDRQPVVLGHQRLVVAGLAVGVERVPQREGHPEEALPGDQPVAVEPGDPVLVADLHVRRVPVQLGPSCQQAFAQQLVTATVAQVPLAGGDDLERLVALFEELDRVLDRPDVPDQVAGLAEHLHDRLPGCEGRGAGQPGIGRPGWLGLQSRRCLGQDAAVPADDGPGGQSELAPPRDVGQVAEGAHHGGASALLRVGEGVGDHRHFDAEQGRAHRGADQRPVPLVVRMGDQGYARRDQLRPGGVDRHDPSAGTMERDRVVGPVSLPILELGLGDRGSEGHVPQRGRLCLVGLTPCEIAQERPLRDGARVVVDRLVGHRPVDGQPELAPQGLEDLLVLDGQLLAQLDEVPP